MLRTVRLFSSKKELEDIFSQKAIRKIRIREDKFCIAKFDQQYFAFDMLCPHQKQSLEEAQITPFGDIVCPLHFYRFNLKDGRESKGLCHDLPTYPLTIGDEGVFVKLP